MPAYNFQKQFVEPILTGQKRSTIRRLREHGNAIPGKPMNLYTGMRTKSCRLLLTVLCLNVRPIVVDVDTASGYFVPSVVIDCRKLTQAEVERFARADGFKDASAFGEFFARMYKLPASLYLIEW